MTEEEARRVVLVRAHESGVATAVWTDDDRAWATRAARQDVGDKATFERFIATRARHAIERLGPRDVSARRWLDRRAWRLAWPLLAGLVAFTFGLAADHIGAPGRVDLLAPPVWAVLAWNLAVYLSLLVPWRTGRLRRWVAHCWEGGAADVRALWAPPSLRLALARAALLLHLAAAALALGLIAGMYMRGLVLDYRAGWQSTFLDAPTVQMVLNFALAPAAATTGIAVPDITPLRLGSSTAATASAAPWIHLYAATLMLFVVLPRLLLAALAAAQAWRLARRFPLPLDGAYFDRLRLQHTGGHPLFDVRPHGAALTGNAALGLRTLLVTHWGNEIDVRIAQPVAYGDEESAATQPAAAGTTVRLALFDMGATPEGEAQGRLLDALAGPLPVLAIVDEAAFSSRFASTPERLQERRAAWQRLAQAHGAGIVCADLAAPNLEAGARLLRAAMA